MDLTNGFIERLGLYKYQEDLETKIEEFAREEFLHKMINSQINYNK